MSRRMSCDAKPGGKSWAVRGDQEEDNISNSSGDYNLRVVLGHEVSSIGQICYINKGMSSSNRQLVLCSDDRWGR